MCKDANCDGAPFQTITITNPDTCWKPKCAHNFSLMTVIPTGGCWIRCPNCGTQIWIQGTTVTC